ncbi:hypothetical protein ElyMa_005628100 [Elysia marginata]|uniref:Uncharacterized protein n=1 Tax=Elysia marginata TaxID=1093978 RepID=A0AAV4F8H7_9GAST|nr:hypothetical protein ElyMa_005628100 [Elysia marginata]
MHRLDGVGCLALLEKRDAGLFLTGLIFRALHSIPGIDGARSRMVSVQSMDIGLSRRHEAGDDSYEHTQVGKLPRQQPQSHQKPKNFYLPWEFKDTTNAFGYDCAQNGAISYGITENRKVMVQNLPFIRTMMLPCGYHINNLTLSLHET